MKFIALILNLALLISACSSGPTSDEAIAEVNGMKISVRDYLNLYENLKPRDVDLSPADRKETRNLVLQTLVRRAVILTTAEERNITVSEEDFMKGIEKFKSDYPEQIFQETLLEGMVDEKDWREQVRQNLLMEKLFESSDVSVKAPSLEEALTYYQEHPHEFQRPAEATAYHIVVGDEELAEDLRSKLLKSRGASQAKLFVSLAVEHSTGPEAKEDSQIVVQKAAMPEAIDSALFEAKLNQISNVVKSEYGFHLFYVTKRTEEVNLDFKRVRNRIFEKLYEEKRRIWLDRFEESLIRESQIQYNRKLISRL